jgi:Bacterial SCP ortholog
MTMRDAQVMAKVKAILEAIAHDSPGHAVELRVPPYAAIQCVEGPRHRRGTPPNVVEMSAEVLLGLSSGDLLWSECVENGSIHASGERSDLSGIFHALAGKK